MNALALLAQAAEPTNVWEWFGDSSQRTVTGDIPSQVWTTLWHSLLAFAIATAVAIPTAAVLAHFRKAEVVSTWLVNLGRVIPTVTIVAVFVIISLRNGYGFEPWPIVIALVLLALPPLYANTYTAVRDASPEVVGAAQEVGLRLCAWSCKARDGLAGTSVAAALARLRAGLAPGAILLLHDAAEPRPGPPRSAPPIAPAVLAALLPELARRQLRAVTLDELLGLPPAPPPPAL